MSRRATDVERAIARAFAGEVERRGGRVCLQVDDLLAMFEVRRFTDASRDRIGEAIAAAGLTADPSLRDATRGSLITIATRRAARPGFVRRPRAGGNRRWYARPRGVVAIAVVLLLLLVGVLSDDSDRDPAATTPIPTATPDTVAEQRADAIAAADQAVAASDYPTALAAIRETDDSALLDRFKRKIARRVLARARSALHTRSYTIAIARSREARRYGAGAAARRLVAAAQDGIAARERAARLARDRRTCDSSERELVRLNASTPSGCSGYAAELAADRAREAEEAARSAAAVDDGDGSTENWCGASRDGDGDGLWCEGESPGDSGDPSSASGSSGNWCGATRDGDGDGIWCEGR